MNKQNHASLNEIAEQVMIEKGFLPYFPEDVIEQVATINDSGVALKSSRDKTGLCWISIDNDDTEDLDQLTYFEKIPDNKSRIYIAVADVNSVVKKDSPIDKYAAHNTTSVYTPSQIFPMLPGKLSTDLTSLAQDEDRNAIVIEIDVDANGKFDLNDIYPGTVRNKAKLAYNSVSAWLDNKAAAPEKVANTQGVKEQLIGQDLIATAIKKYRDEQGALNFKTTELVPIVTDGIPTKLVEQAVNRGRLLIENFMIAANVAMTIYMTNQKMPAIRRVVRTPKRWDRIVSLAKEHGYELPADPDAKALQDFLSVRRKADPDHFQDLSLTIIKLVGRGEYIVAAPGDTSIGHFDLALAIYSHTTAPNRRYPDLIMQRLLRSHFENTPIPYTISELQTITDYCTQKENDATKVERRVLKSAAAMVLENQLGKIYSAMVTGVNNNGVWIRLISPPIEGKLNQTPQSIDVGDKLNVKLVHVDVDNGYIDFIPVNSAP